MNEVAASRGGVIAGCSALKRAYRAQILETLEWPALFVFLDGSRETLYRRMSRRSDHYMPPSLLDSQLADLEKPGPDEAVLTLSIEAAVDDLVESALTVLRSSER